MPAKRNTNPMIHLGSGMGAVRRADVVALDTDEMAFFQTFHKIAQKYDLGLHCSHCGKDIQGANSGYEATFSVSCGCREFHGERPRLGGANGNRHATPW